MPTITEDRDEIRQLLNAYCHAVDARDGARWAACFTEGGTFEADERLIIHESTMGTTMTPPREGLRHTVANDVIAVDGDSATVESYVLTFAGTPPQLVAIGTWSDTLRRTPEGWRIVQRLANLDDLEAERPLDEVTAYIATFK
jgi:3-phenylpropionate/cinnamic acid dioxygenase small subunit